MKMKVSSRGSSDQLSYPYSQISNMIVSHYRPRCCSLSLDSIIATSLALKLKPCFHTIRLVKCLLIVEHLMRSEHKLLKWFQIKFFNVFVLLFASSTNYIDLQSAGV